MRTSRLLIVLLTLVLPGIVLLPAWRLAGLGAEEDDVLYYYPSRVFFHETVPAGQLPWLNDQTGLGRPFLADPQSAVFYPPTWLFAVLEPLQAYPLSLWLHYSLALWGMYRLLRARRLAPPAAFFGAIAFAFSGFLLAHRAHFTMQHAAAWTPWVFWRLHRYAQSGGTQRLASAGLVAALQCFAGHVQIAALTGLGSLVYLLADSRGNPRVALRWLLNWCCVAGLFAVQWLPTLAYLSICTRMQHGYLDFVENSWNPISAVGWILPMLFGQRIPNFFEPAYWGPSHQVEQFAYAGILPLLLAALAIRAGWRSNNFRRGWVALLVFSLLLALGLYGPICPMLYWLPGACVFRVPARALLLVNLTTAALAAGVLQDLGGRLSPHRARLRAVALAWTRRPILKAALLLLTPLVPVGLAVPFLPAEVRQAALVALRPWNPTLWVPAVVLLVSIALLGFVTRRWQQPRWLGLLGIVTVLDLAVIGWTIDVPPDHRPQSARLADPGRESWLAHVRGSPQRLWVVTARQGNTPGEYIHPRRKGVANLNVLDHVASLTDYGPLQPAVLHARFPFEPWGELPDARQRLRDTAWMQRLNVGWILLCEPDWPAPADARLVTTTPDGFRLYHYPHTRGPAFFDDATQPGAVRYVEQSHRSFVTHIDTWPSERERDGPADKAASVRVVASRLALPGWEARANGTPLEVGATEDALLVAGVPASGPVEVEWSYSPPGLFAGVTITVLSVVLLACCALFDRAHQRARTRPPAPTQT